ncbi:hypothetical protein B0H11DRAFT_1907377 [Mycena galericulata]|nr:hypothetical protein B0H11DRAFT_1907377 [Mycena galericulata]
MITDVKPWKACPNSHADKGTKKIVQRLNAMASVGDLPIKHHEPMVMVLARSESKGSRTMHTDVRPVTGVKETQLWTCRDGLLNQFFGIQIHGSKQSPEGLMAGGYEGYLTVPHPVHRRGQSRANGGKLQPCRKGWFEPPSGSW